MEHFTPIVIAAIVTAVGLILSKFIEKINTFPSKPDYDKDAEVDAVISLIRHKYQCARVSILAYHNGGYWMDNTSQSKFTLRHESCDDLTPTLMPVLNNIGTTILKEQPSILDKDNIMFEPDIELMKDELEPSYYETMRNFKTTSTLAVSVHKKIWSWKALKYEKRFVASFHMNWSENKWPIIFLTNYDMRVQLIKEINKVIKSYCPNAIVNNNLLDNFLSLCNKLKNKYNVK